MYTNSLAMLKILSQNIKCSGSCNYIRTSKQKNVES